jgi:plasmid stabilization system protein ParE
MPKLRYSSEARIDLAEIKEHIGSGLGNPCAAIHTVTYITKRIRDLEQFPEMGTPLSSVVDIETSYRFLVCKNISLFIVLRTRKYISFVCFTVEGITFLSFLTDRCGTMRMNNTNTSVPTVLSFYTYPDTTGKTVFWTHDKCEKLFTRRRRQLNHFCLMRRYSAKCLKTL